MILETIDDGIAACLRAQLVMNQLVRPEEDALLRRKIRRATKALEEAKEIMRAKQGILHLIQPIQTDENPADKIARAHEAHLIGQKMRGQVIDEDVTPDQAFRRGKRGT